MTDTAIITDRANDTKNFITTLANIKREHARTRKGFHYHGPEDFVLANGKQYRVNYDTLNRFGVGTPKECYKNSTDYVLNHLSQGLTYVEGYVSCVIPILHAWVVDADGEIADLTLSVADRKEQYYPCDYYGVEVPTPTLMALLNYTGKYGLIDSWQAGWPLFKQPWDPMKVGKKYARMPRVRS